MSCQSIPLKSPPHVGTGLDSKIFSASRRYFLIHLGSCFWLLISSTICFDNPFGALYAYSSVGLANPYLYLCPKFFGSTFLAFIGAKRAIAPPFQCFCQLFASTFDYFSSHHYMDKIRFNKLK